MFFTAAKCSLRSNMGDIVLDLDLHVGNGVIINYNTFNLVENESITVIYSDNKQRYYDYIPNKYRSAMRYIYSSIKKLDKESLITACLLVRKNDFDSKYEVKFDMNKFLDTIMRGEKINGL